MDSHALDGLIARSASLFGVSLLLLPLFLGWLATQPDERRDRKCRLSGLALGIFGAIVQLNAHVLSVSDFGYDEPSVWRPELAEFGRWLEPALFETVFGLWWLAHVAILALAAALLFVRRTREGDRWPAWIAAAWLFTFVRTGHASDGGPWQLVFLIQWVHTAAAAAWLSGLLAVAGMTMESHEPIGRPRLRRLSRVMLVSMLTLLMTGAARTGSIVWTMSEGWSASLYIRVLAAKLGFVLVVLGVAAAVRARIVRADSPVVAAAELRQMLSVEVLCASLIVFASTLLSQIAPP